ncbi:hypothetical protein [Streptomyces sp. NBC_00268]|uniref:hypothetical protein n=1 Tax=Streptomyces sp. NBC_00268 TaxID=2975695 RepID=UPI0022511F92|nr:hypothetical protein [Streptomyces sp. NBC_00268]MCX5181165.1 hypothetical protein [Streptomyces sp. NBC_00268]
MPADNDPSVLQRAQTGLDRGFAPHHLHLKPVIRALPHAVHLPAEAVRIQGETGTW